MARKERGVGTSVHELRNRFAVLVFILSVFALLALYGWHVLYVLSPASIIISMFLLMLSFYWSISRFFMGVRDKAWRQKKSMIRVLLGL